MQVSIKRVYEKASASDGKRILVDRLWPRGVSKASAKIDIWLKEVSPSDKLRKWFGHDPKKWEEFQKRYRDEIKNGDAFSELQKIAKKMKCTLVYGAKDEEHNDAVVLKMLLEKGK